MMGIRITIWEILLNAQDFVPRCCLLKVRHTFKDVLDKHTNNSWYLNSNSIQEVLGKKEEVLSCAISHTKIELKTNKHFRNLLGLHHQGQCGKWLSVIISTYIYLLMNAMPHKRAVSDWVVRTLTFRCDTLLLNLENGPLSVDLSLSLCLWLFMNIFIHSPLKLQILYTEKEPWRFHSNPHSNVTSQHKYW
jgi:hypothetical protein